MNALEHSDQILAARPGETLLAVEPVSAVNMREGGVVSYGVGARFRVKHTTGDLLWCCDDEARTVTFAREDMAALARKS